MKTYKNYQINIIQDDDCFSPRENDNLGKMICFHRNYELGDKHDLSPDELTDLIKNLKGVALPLYLYDHSGITMYTNNNTVYHQHEQWDTSTVGYIYASLEMIRENFQVKKVTKKLLKQTEEILRAEIKEYDNYLTGNVYGYQVLKDGEILDSCWGFIGDEDESGLMDQAKGYIDYDIKDRLKKKLDKVKTYIKNHVPLEKRILTV